MNLDELRSAQAKERRKDSLQHLRDSFYDDVAAYVSDLRAARDRRAEQVAKPFSDDDVRRMSDEVETAEEVAEALYERRVGKVVKLASFAAADMPVDADGMTTEERQLFDDLVERISQNKSRVLDVLSGETPPTGEHAEAGTSTGETTPAGETTSTGEVTDRAPPAPEPEPPGGTESAASADGTEPQSPDTDAGALAGAMGGDDEVDDTPEAPPGDAPSEDHAPPEPDDATTDGGPTAVSSESAPPSATDPGEAGTATEDRMTVRITRNVGPIFGVDEREYDLASDDVVTLPVENADPLVQRDAAERLD